jgi:Tfp pilus assembly protein PilV
MDTIMEDTLIHLINLDPYWSNLDKNELAKMLHAYWRNAGKWRLVAENDNPQHATQAVLTWEDVVVDRVHDAIYESQKLIILDKQLESLTLTQSQVISRTAELINIRESLNTWRTSAARQDTKLPVNEIDRELINNLLDKAEMGNARQQLSDALPSSKAPLHDYITWLDSVFSLLDQQILISQTQIAALEDKKNEVAKIYADSSPKSLGLSANLQVDKITTSQPEHTIARPTGLLVLIGGILGLISWVILWLTRISLYARK